MCTRGKLRTCRRSKNSIEDQFYEEAIIGANYNKNQRVAKHWDHQKDIMELAQVLGKGSDNDEENEVQADIRALGKRSKEKNDVRTSIQDRHGKYEKDRYKLDVEIFEALVGMSGTTLLRGFGC